MATGQRLAHFMQEVMSEVKEIDVASLHSTEDSSVIIIDVRSEKEWQDGYIPGAISLPRGTLEFHIEEHVPPADQAIVVYCGGGTRSALCAFNLQHMGYQNVKSLAGGFGAWRQAGFDVAYD